MWLKEIRHFEFCFLFLFFPCEKEFLFHFFAPCQKLKPMQSNPFDFIIIGSGPSGLSFAAYVPNKRILILEKEQSIGGCHRVVRCGEEKLFSEHGPRIYSSSYLHFKELLKQMGTSYSELFVPYQDNLLKVGNKTILQVLSIRELWHLMLAFFSFSNSHDQMTVQEFMQEKKFSSRSMEFIDRLVRLTDGAGSDRYSLNEFLNIFNQQAFYSIDQPRVPNDIGLFQIWSDYLLSKTNVEIQTSFQIQSIMKEKALFQVQGTAMNKNPETYCFYAHNIVCAIPPISLVRLLKSTCKQKKLQNAFGSLESLKQFAEATKYLDYESVTFHWRKRILVLADPNVYGFPLESELGIAFIVLSNYMKEIETSKYKTIVSCIATNPSSKKNSISLKEMFQEFRKTFPNHQDEIPSPDQVIRYPLKEESFIKVPKWSFLAAKSPTIEGFYNLGTHNGNSEYVFTSMESAVSNSLALANQITNCSHRSSSSKNPFFLWTVKRTMIIIASCSLLFFLFFMGIFISLKVYLDAQNCQCQ
jgi:protoporphyrinogen oxidase